MLEPLIDLNFKTLHNFYPFEHFVVSNFLTFYGLKLIKNIAKDVTPTGCSLKRTENTTRYFVKNGELADCFSSKKTKALFSKIINTDLEKTRTRIEICVDRPGFSLEPHIDIPEKLLTLQLYISGEPHCGTDLYPERILFEVNTGWIIKNGPNTLHGFTKRDFTEPRVSLILNYVNNDWWDVDQLCIQEFQNE